MFHWWFSFWGSSMVLLTAAQNSFLSYSGSPTSVVMCVCMCTQSCLTLHNPIDCSLSSSCVYGILQARILERVVMSCSRGSSWLMDQTCISCVSFIGRQILYHWATSEALLWNFRRLIFSFFFFLFFFFIFTVWILSLVLSLSPLSLSIYIYFFPLFYFLYSPSYAWLP